MVIFCLPTADPVTTQTLNYTPVAVGIVAVFALGSWFLWARRWFTGPVRHVEVVHGPDGQVKKKVELTTGQEVLEGADGNGKMKNGKEITA